MKYWILTLAISITLTSCEKNTIIGSGVSQTELRNLTGFNKIRVEGRTGVNLVQGNAFKVEVKAYNNLLPVLETKVVGGTLHIRFKEGTSVANDNSEVAVILPSLIALTATGSSRIEIISGSADNFEVELIGSASMHAFGLIARDAFIRTEGSGNAELTVTDNLRVSITGSGNVYYKGKAFVTSTITGSGKVIKK